MQPSGQRAGKDGFACYWHRLLWSHIPKQCSILDNKESPEACRTACAESYTPRGSGSPYWYIFTLRCLLKAEARCSYDLQLPRSCKQGWGYTKLTWACVHKDRALETRVGNSGQYAHRPWLNTQACDHLFAAPIKSTAYRGPSLEDIGKAVPDIASEC